MDASRQLEPIIKIESLMTEQTSAKRVIPSAGHPTPTHKADHSAAACATGPGQCIIQKDWNAHVTHPIPNPVRSKENIPN